MAFLTVADLGERWQVSGRQVREMAAAGLVPAMRIGKLWRFSEERIVAWERAQERSVNA